LVHGVEHILPCIVPTRSEKGEWKVGNLRIDEWIRPGRYRDVVSSGRCFNYGRAWKRRKKPRFVPSGLESDELWALSSRETAVLLDVQYSPFGNPRHRFVLLLSPLVPIIIDRLHLSKRSFRFTSASFVLESVREGPVAPRPPPTRKLDGRHSSTIGLMDNQ